MWRGPDADQGRRAVPPRRALGRPRLPAHRHAARHRRRPDGPGPAAARAPTWSIVTTPALAAQKVAQRAADMARRSFLRVVGVIENMSDFTCEHGDVVRAVRRRRRRGAGRRDRRAAARPGAARAGGGRRRRRRPAGGARRRRAGPAAAAFRAIADRLDAVDRPPPTRPPRRSTWPAARPACSTPPSSARPLDAHADSVGSVERRRSRGRRAGRTPTTLAGRRRGGSSAGCAAACRRRRPRPAPPRPSRSRRRSAGWRSSAASSCSSPASAWARASAGRTHRLSTISASSCAPSWSVGRGGEEEAGVEAPRALADRRHPVGDVADRREVEHAGRGAGTAPPSTARRRGRPCARRRRPRRAAVAACGPAARRPPRSTPAPPPPRRRGRRGRCRAAPRRWRRRARRSTARARRRRSTSSTRPPGNTYMPAAKAALAVRRSTNTSTPASAVRSASRTSTTVAAGRAGTTAGRQWLVVRSRSGEATGGSPAGCRRSRRRRRRATTTAPSTTATSRQLSLSRTSDPVLEAARRRRSGGADSSFTSTTQK